MPEQPIADPLITTDPEATPLPSVETPIEVTNKIVIEDPSVEPTAEELQTESLIESKVPKGEDSVSDSTLGGVSFFAMIGAGNGAKGARGARDGGGIHRAIGVGLGGPWTTRAIDASLDWFARHQDPTGKWDPATYFQNCADDAKCEPGNAGQSGAISAVTAYAMMTMVHAGNDHVTPSRYKKNVARAVQWLVANQQADGSWGRNYENAIVVMALAELVSMTNDLALAKVTQRGVDVILARQNKDPAAKDPKYAGLGWDYEAPGSRNDSSVTGWNVMALKSAMSAGLKVGNALGDTKHWLDGAWKATNPDWQRLDPYGVSRFPYTWTTGTASVDISAGPSMAGKDLACVGGLVAVFLGRKAGDPMVETLTNYAYANQKPAAWPTNTYYLYYNTLAMFQAGGDKWKGWVEMLRTVVAPAQRKDGCHKGSWDWQGSQFHGHDTGRTLSTAYATLAMESFFTWQRIAAAQ